MLNDVSEDEDFQFHLAKVISHAIAVDSHALHPPSTHPQYIPALLNGIL